MQIPKWLQVISEKWSAEKMKMKPIASMSARRMEAAEQATWVHQDRAKPADLVFQKALGESVRESPRSVKSVTRSGVAQSLQKSKT